MILGSDNRPTFISRARWWWASRSQCFTLLRPCCMSTHTIERLTQCLINDQCSNFQSLGCTKPLACDCFWYPILSPFDQDPCRQRYERHAYLVSLDRLHLLYLYFPPPREAIMKLSAELPDRLSCAVFPCPSPQQAEHKSCVYTCPLIPDWVCETTL